MREVGLKCLNNNFISDRVFNLEDISLICLCWD